MSITLRRMDMLPAISFTTVPTFETPRIPPHVLNGVTPVIGGEGTGTGVTILQSLIARLLTDVMRIAHSIGLRNCTPVIETGCSPESTVKGLCPPSISAFLPNSSDPLMRAQFLIVTELVPNENLPLR